MELSHGDDGKAHVSRALVAGAVGTLVMTLMIYAAPGVRMPAMDLAALIGSMLSHQMPEPMSPSWWVGMMLHFVNGIFIFPLIYIFLLYPVLLGWPWFRGLCWALILWILAQTLLMPIMGFGFFTVKAPRPMWHIMSSLVAHLLYGVLLGLLAGPQPVRVPSAESKA
ncbi:MAG: hypothetical protein L0387_24205 [Acidobacteria bacterium]|nr:hypothetical protein [Acidobacteriota bacterium]